MKKTIALLVTAGICVSALGVYAEEKTDEMQKAEYTLYNATGASLEELYLYSADSEDKGENLAADGFAKGESIVIEKEATAEEAEAAVYVIEFKAAGMEEARKFETLHFEVAPISLMAVDATSGATPIAFAAPEAHAEYTVYNTTGAKVTELYFYDSGSEAKGRNLAGEDGIADGESIVLTRDASEEESKEAVFTLEFKAEDMEESQKFETLHFEEAPISLLSIDAASGATAIAFAAPEA